MVVVVAEEEEEEYEIDFAEAVVVVWMVADDCTVDTVADD